MVAQYAHHFDFWGLIFDTVTTKVVKAIAHGDIAHLQKLLDKLDLKTVNDFRFGPGWGFLHYAALLGQDDALRALIDHHANVNIKTSCHETPLFMAVRHKHLSSVKYLLAHQADPKLCASSVEVNGLIFKNISPMYLAGIMREIDIQSYIGSFLRDANIKCNDSLEKSKVFSSLPILQRYHAHQNSSTPREDMNQALVQAKRLAPVA